MFRIYFKKTTGPILRNNLGKERKRGGRTVFPHMWGVQDGCGKERVGRGGARDEWRRRQSQVMKCPHLGEDLE